MNRRRATLRVGLVVGAWTIVAACGGDDGKDSSAGSSDAALVAAATSKLKDCKLYDTKSGNDNFKIQDETDRCEARCVSGAACADLKSLRCDELPSRTNAVLLCIAKCPTAPTDGYACSDGTKIAHLALCDGSSDCDDDADEKNCKTYSCKDGEKVELADPECDGFADCEDGSDEASCSPICE